MWDVSYKTVTPFDLVILLLGISPWEIIQRETQAEKEKKRCHLTKMLMPALFGSLEM